MSDQDSGVQAEIKALEAVLTVLEPLDDSTRRLVLAYVHERFGVAGRLPSLSEAPTVQRAEPLSPETVQPSTPTPPITDIRTLKETKQPKSAVEMAVVTAYYARELAPADKRKETIGTTEIVDYFKQADYPLPSVPRNVLMFAKNSGYLDAATTRGQYSLNPVGYNLVAHSLPRATGAASSSGSRAASPSKSRKRKSAARSKKTTSSRKRTSRSSGGKSRAAKS